PDVPTKVAAVPASMTQAPVPENATPVVPAAAAEAFVPAPERVKLCPEIEVSDPRPVVQPSPPPRVAPLGAERYSLQLTMPGSTGERLMRAQDRGGPRGGAGASAKVLARPWAGFTAQQEKKNFAATNKPRVGKPSTTPRHIPARVKREVAKRDQGQCTFV